MVPTILPNFWEWKPNLIHSLFSPGIFKIVQKIQNFFNREYDYDW